MREVVVVDAVRTPIGRYGGALATVRPDDLAALVVGAVVQRSGVDPARIDDVLLGDANQSGEDNRNVARMAVLLAGLPVEVPGATINRLCGSSLQAINSAANAIAAGEADVIVAGGVESMSRAPYVMMKPQKAFDRAPEIVDTTLGWRMVNPKMRERYPPLSLGETAEKVAEQYGISREEQDRFAFCSQQRARAAVANGAFIDELIPVPVKDAKLTREVTLDEHPRPEVTLEDLAALQPAFKRGGTVTAGNSSGVNDGAAALLLCDGATASAMRLKPIARVVAGASAGVHPDVMGLGPVPATKKALARSGLEIRQLDLVEINEAFASQALACMRDLGFDPEKTNVNGGAIALGHPLGASGARLATTLLHELRRREGRYALATMCVGVGQGITTVFERI